MPLEVFPARQATCRAVFGTWGFFPDDARASHYPFVLTSFTGCSSKRCPGIGFLSRGDREIGVLRNVEPPTRHIWNVVVRPGVSQGCSRAAATVCGFSLGTTARSVSSSGVAMAAGNAHCVRSWVPKGRHPRARWKGRTTGQGTGTAWSREPRSQPSVGTTWRSQKGLASGLKAFTAPPLC